MAHGNVSDLAFLLLLIGAIQTWALPDLLFSSAVSADPGANALLKFSGGLAFTLGLTFSGVKWNPINGKMGAVGGFFAIINAVVLGARTGHIFFYAFAAMLLIGIVHIGAFPSNPLVPKGPTNVNNHGNVSDIVALVLLVGSLTCFFYQAPYFADMGPLKASFSATPDTEALLSYCGGLMLTLGMILSGVKWNPINGKMACIGYFTTAGIGVYFGGAFFYVYAAVLAVAGVHVGIFPSNPLPPKAKA